MKQLKAWAMLSSSLVGTYPNIRGRAEMICVAGSQGAVFVFA